MSCKATTVEHDYPVQNEIQIVNRQAKYGTFTRESGNLFDKKSNNTSQSICERIEVYAMQKFAKITMLQNNQNKCIIKFENDMETGNIISDNTIEKTDVIVFNKKDNQMIKNTNQSQQYTKELHNTLLQ